MFSRKPLANKFDGEKDSCSLDDSDGFSSIGVFNKQNNNVILRDNNSYLHDNVD